MNEQDMSTVVVEQDVTLVGGINPATLGTDRFAPNHLPIQEATFDTTSRVEAGNEKDSTQSLLISAGSVSFILKGRRYKAVRSISESSGEAQIVLVENMGKQYCLKVYYPNFRFKDDILNAVWNVNMDMVVKLYDYGHTVVNGIERDYELMEFLDGGTLAQYALKGDMLKFRIIALQAAASLEAIHSYGIIHKDIKPGNFFFRDKEHTQLVLGDFGISSMMKDGDELLRTSQARTPAFAAPEMYDDVIDGEVEINNKVDFYSLGITLLYLWLGKSPFTKNERLMMRLKQEGKLPHLEELPKEVATIIKGLTSINPQRRWGYDEVERWFKGEDVPVDTSSVYLRYKTFMVDPDRNLAAHDVKELVPLLYENQQLGIRYLYSNRLSNWLDECGNSKMALLLNDIVEHRFPTDQQAGLMAALYAMEPNFPYYDIHEQPCKTLQEIAMTLLHNAQEYQYKLQNPNDELFLFLDTHFSLNMQRLHSYFSVPSERSVIKMVYEIDNTMPFLFTAPSETLREVIQAYASPERTEDEWTALSDGRFLAWLSGRVDNSLIEAVRLMSGDMQVDVRTRGYQILYNVDRTSAFDLKDASTVNQVAQLLAEKLLACQEMDDEQFAQETKDYLVGGNRLEIYARIHQWENTQQAIREMLNLKAPQNQERYCMYDIHTAAYKFCKSMGVQPGYQIIGDEYQQVVYSLDELSELPVKDVRHAIRNGHLMQWISTFYQEDPTRIFEDEMEYNNCVKDFLEMVGSYDGGEMHYKRFTFAQEQMERKVTDSRLAWKQTMHSKNRFRFIFLGVNLLWIAMLAIFGIEITPNMASHTYAFVMLLVGLPLGAMLAVRNYFRGNGFSLGILFILLGIVCSLIPAAILSACIHNNPGLTNIAAIVMSAIFMGVGLKYAFGKSTVGTVTDEMKNAFELNEAEALNEMLYYTFKMRTFKFKGSTFALMDDALGEAKSSSTEKVINCAMWSLLPACLIVAMVVFHSGMLDHYGPDIDAWKKGWSDFWMQFAGLFN